MSIFVKSLWLFGVSFCGIYAVTKDLALNLAECFFDSENYEDAVTEYKRFIFFNPQSDSVNYAYYKIGMAHRNKNKWKESISALQQSIETAPNDSVRNEREIALAIVLIGSGNYSAAEFQLLRVESFSQFLTLRRRASFFRGIASLYSFKWEEARKSFSAYFEKDTVNKISETTLPINSLFWVTRHLKYKSPKLAKLLSTFLPGAGQIYAGDWRNGLNALTVNSITVYLLVSSLIKGDYTSVLLSYLSLFQRYYFGNRFHAEKITENYNDRLNKQFLKNLLKDISNEQVN